MKLKTDQVGRAGEAFVVAEILRRGGYAVSFAGNMPGIDIIASDAAQSRHVTIQVKTETSAGWQTSIDKGRDWKQDPQDGRFWVLVDLLPAPAHPEYHVAPTWDAELGIKQASTGPPGPHGARRAR